ncbi:protein FAR-RED ELONGATED HYPOCOTYL 1 [Eucalyptus grandis]|uniref:protein FAR-RED ELONGATED HYPOCOTYL 1 n=1 Tax=Eucalyptus grandis TaxID=71139 RepID=UPI00192ED461|nr:protein FAR-RED ELONGATED HYPOCOTYL 1 [Eucalyptus grandis]
MDQDDENPSNINRKRKLQPELLVLPLPKHQCWDQGTIQFSTFNKHLEKDDISKVAIKGKVDVSDNNDGTRPESEKDSYSFVEYSDSTMSLYGMDNCETESTSISNLHSVLSTSCGCANSENPSYSSHSTMVLDKEDSNDNLVPGLQDVIPLSHNSQLRVKQILEEHLLEFGNHADHICLEEGKDFIDQCHDDETEDIIYSNGEPSNNFVLSSGRWIVNREAQHSTRRPTIDQEFEQYFSMLML